MISELSWVYLTAVSHSTSSSCYRAPLWGPWPDFILILSIVTVALFCSSCTAPSLTRGRVCNLQCNRWLVRSLRTNNHTLPSHLRLCSLFVASYDWQGLRWRYSNPPPHGVGLGRNNCLLCLIPHERHRKRRIQQFIYSVRIHCRGQIITETLSSNDGGVFLGNDRHTYRHTHRHIHSDGRYLWSTLFGWAQVPWYTFHWQGGHTAWKQDKPTLFFKIIKSV
jgi:hypothetical protein